jgi:hypothetical protein
VWPSSRSAHHPVARWCIAFSHAFFRQTLYEEISAPRRLRWHQLAGRALKQAYPTRLDEHAAELAEHFAHSTNSDDLAKAVAYGQLAAKRAMSVYAYSVAVRLLEHALEVQAVLDPAAKTERCDLLLALGEAMHPTDQPSRVAETVASEAFAIAEASQDSPRAARAAIQALDGFFRGGPEMADFPAWTARADRHAADGSPERVYADTYLGFQSVMLASQQTVTSTCAEPSNAPQSWVTRRLTCARLGMR